VAGLALATGKQAERVVQHAGHLVGGQQGQPRRHQLDRQWQAVEPPADLRQRSMVEVGRLEAGIQAGCAIREQGNRVSRLKTRQHPGGLARKP